MITKNKLNRIYSIKYAVYTHQLLRPIFHLKNKESSITCDMFLNMSFIT